MKQYTISISFGQVYFKRFFVRGINGNEFKVFEDRIRISFLCTPSVEQECEYWFHEKIEY